MDQAHNHTRCGGAYLLFLWMVYISNRINDQKSCSKMKKVPYTRPPKKEPQSVPKFELFINYEEYTWECIVDDSPDDYDGTFSIDLLTNQVHIDWYRIPMNDEFWEEVEDQLRKIITANLVR